MSHECKGFFLFFLKLIHSCCKQQQKHIDENIGKLKFWLLANVISQKNHYVGGKI